MANRYWVGGSGDWTDTSHWSTTSGSSGGASVPTSSDDVIVDANSAVANCEIRWNASKSVRSFTSVGFPYTLDLKFISGAAFFLTLFASVSIRLHNVHSSGTSRLELSGSGGISGQADLYQTGTTDGNLRIGSQISLKSNFTGYQIYNQLGKFSSNGNTINLSNGITSGSNSGQTIDLTNSIVNITGTSTTINPFNTISTGTLITTGSTININSTTFFATSRPEYVYNVINVNAPTTRINGTLSVRRLIINGATPDIRGSGSGVINYVGSGQILPLELSDLENVTSTGSGGAYAGASAIGSGTTTGWTFADAPLVNTLTDTFTSPTIDTDKWTVTSGSLSQTSGALTFTGSGFATATMIAKNQYLTEGSGIKFKASVPVGSLTVYLAIASQQYGVNAGRDIPDISLFISPTQVRLNLNAASTFSSPYYTNSYTYFQIRESGGSIYIDGSTDGIAYTNITSVVAADYGLDTTQLVARPNLAFYRNETGTITVDDFNIELEPTALFTQDKVSGNTPLTIQFTDQSNFSPTSWSWDFGDSTSSTSQNPSKTYSAPGTYTVSLTASKTGTSRSVTKTNLITVSPNVYTRSITGTLIFGGSAARVMTSYRSASGSLVLGGGVRAVVLIDVEAIQDKTYLYKVYDEDGSYIEVWKDVISELNYTHEINSVGSTTNVELARNSDSLGVSVSPLQTESGIDILTESDQQLLVATESRNQIGSGSSVDYNNRVEVTAYYGSIEPLLTEDLMELLTEDDEPILADVGSPNGRVIFSGFISDINSRYGNSETTLVQLTSYGWDLDQFPITTAFNNEITTVPFNSVDPSTIAITAIDRFVQRSNLDEITYTNRTDTSISTTGTVVSYTFKANTYKDVLDKTLELMPSNWYYRVGLGDNIVYFRERATTPHHLFYLGKHIKAEDLKGSILDSTNNVLFTGGGDPALYVQRKEPLAPRTRRRLKIISDSRVTLEDSAEIISDGIIEQSNKIQYRTTVEILTKQYDIESISVGEVVGFRNFGNYVDGLTMQIVGLSYAPDVVQLQLETKPPTINKRLEDISRNLKVTENENVPTTPS